MIRRAGLLCAALALACPAGSGAQQAPGATPPTAAPPAAATPPPAATSGRPDAALYATQPFLTDVLLSPDGTRIAALIHTNGRKRIGIFRVGAPPSDQPQVIPLAQVEDFRWADDNRLLIREAHFLIMRSSYAVYFGPAQRVISYDLTTGKVIALGHGTGAFEDIIFLDPAGRFVLLAKQESIEEPPAVYRVELSTGNFLLVEPARRGVWSWHADENGVVRVGVDYGERRTNIYYRNAAGEPLQRVRPQRNLTDNSVIDQVRFTGGARGLIVTNSETGRFGVYPYDFAADTLGAALFEHPQVDVDDMLTDAAGTLTGVTYHDDQPRTRWFDADLAALQQQVDRNFPGKANRIVNRSRDGNRALIFSFAADDPGTYYVMDRQARRLELFASPFDELQAIPHAPVRAISFPARDGTIINGYLTVPPGREARNLPLILLPHGGPFLRERWGFDPEVQFLVSRGYAVLQPNFRGSTGYGREFVKAGFGQLGGGMIDDMEAAVDWAAGEGIADPRRVCIMGSSYGGYAALWASIRNPARYRCAISWAGPTNLRSMLRHTARGFAARRYFRTYRSQIEGEPATDLDAISPARQAARIRIPTLLAHGRADRIVPLTQYQELTRAITRARIGGVETVEYEKSGHSFEDSGERTDYLRRVEAFLARHNPAS